MGISAYARGGKAWGLCQRCGLRFLLRDLTFDEHIPGLRVCHQCFDEKHPQECKVDVHDPQALWRPSPDTTSYAADDAPVLALEVDGADMALSWTSVTFQNDTLGGYRVYRSTDNITFALLDTVTAGIDTDTFLWEETLEYTDSTAITGTTYYYYVTAYGIGHGQTATSNTVSGTIQQTIEFPFTYDTNYKPGTFSDWASITDDGMLVDTDGLVVERFSGFEAIVNTAPYFSTGQAFGAQATATVFAGDGKTTALDDTTYVYPVLALHDTSDNAAALLLTGIDGNDPNVRRVEFAQYNGTTQAVRKSLNRTEWRFQWRRHDSTVNGQASMYVQALCFHPTNGRLIYSIHAADTASKFYEVDTATGAVTRSCTTLTYSHISSLRYTPALGWFAIDYHQVGFSVLLKVDMDASLDSGSLVVSWTATLLNEAGSMEFFTADSTLWVLIAEFAIGGGGASTRLYDASVLTAGWNENAATPAGYWTNNGRTQGLYFDAANSILYESNNSADAGGSGREGLILAIDLLDWYTNGLDGDDYSDYIIDSYSAPSGYPEELALDSNGRMWVGTESNLSFGDDLTAYSSIWSSALTHDGEANTYTVNYDGAGTYSLYLNGQAFDTVSQPNGADFQILRVGMLNGEDSTAGFNGTVANVYVTRDTVVDLDYYDTLAEDTRTLTRIPLTMTNPGAESSTTGWTNEVGAIAVRSGNPPPRAGAGYFYGGAVASTRARQRLDLEALTGFTVAQMDAQAGYFVLEWYQAAFSATDDYAACGLRTLNAASGTLTEKLPSAYLTYPDTLWFKRRITLSRDALTKYLDVLMRMTRYSGTNNDGYIDQIAVAYVRQT